MTIKGRLVDAENRPVAGVKLFGMAEESGLWLRDHGTAGRLHDVERPGRPQVIVQGLGQRPRAAGRCRDRQGRAPVAPPGRRQATGPRDAGTAGVSGTVVNAEGRPVEGVEVNLTGRDRPQPEARDADHRRPRGLPRRASDREGTRLPGDRAAGPIRDRIQRDTVRGRGGFHHPAADRRGPDADDRRPGRQHRGPTGGRRPRAQLGKSRPPVRRRDRADRPFPARGFPAGKGLALRQRARLPVPSRDIPSRGNRRPN